MFSLNIKIQKKAVIYRFSREKTKAAACFYKGKVYANASLTVPSEKSYSVKNFYSIK